MSTPIQHDNTVDDLDLYAPRWAREQSSVDPPGADSPSTAPEQNAEALKPEGGDTQARSAPTFWTESAESPPVAPAIREGDRTAQDAPQDMRTPRMPQGIGGPNIDWHPPLPRRPRTRHMPRSGGDGLDMHWPPPPLRLPEFEGDVAVKAMRQRLSLDPSPVPKPPIRPRTRAVLPSFAWMVLVMLVAAGVAYTITLLSLPDRARMPLNVNRAVAMASLPDITLTQPHPVARLIVEGRQTFANEALPLGIALNGESGGEFALLTGLAVGTRLSVGGPLGATGWRLPARELGKALAFAPRDFVGVMDAAIDLRAPNDSLVDRQMLRLEWVPKKAEVQPHLPSVAREDKVLSVVREDKGRPGALAALDAEEVAGLIRRGVTFLQTGDIASARLVLRRAANSGNPQAALALGATFDPLVLAELGVLGFAPDTAQARNWYQRAAQSGSAEAVRRIERLAQVGN